MMWAGRLDDNGGSPQTYAGAGRAQAGASVVMWKFDRLGLNTLRIPAAVKKLTDRGVTLVSTTDGTDSSTAAGRMVVGVLVSMAEFERELVKERTALKREAAQKNGTSAAKRASWLSRTSMGSSSERTRGRRRASVAPRPAVADRCRRIGSRWAGSAASRTSSFTRRYRNRVGYSFATADLVTMHPTNSGVGGAVVDRNGDVVAVGVLAASISG
jgi:Resolvase, N terminal domain